MTNADSTAPGPPPVITVDDAHDQAVEVLRGGGVVVLPTDTVYGVAASATHRQAIERIYALKQRPADLAIALLVADAEQATQLVELSPGERSVAHALWPGALTLVLRRHASTDERLGRDDGTVGLRSPASDFVRSLAREVGPLATTSANLSGSPTAPTAELAAASLDGDVDLIVDGGPCAGAASTVARVAEDGTVTVYRQGAMTADQIESAARPENSG